MTQNEIIEKAEQDEPFEYLNAVEGWVKIDEVRRHFDSVGCGTIYKRPGEGRVPLYLIHPQPKAEQDKPVALVTGVYGGRFTYAPIKESVVLPVGMALYTHPQPKAKQEPTSGFFSREAMKEHSDFHPQTKAGQDEPVFHLKQYGDVTKEQLDCYIATGRIDTHPQHREWVDLTGEELETLLRENRTLTLGAIWAVSNKLKEKNNG